MIAGPPTPEFYTGCVHLPVRSPEDGRWRCRSRFLEDGTDWPMVGADSMGALLLALRAVGIHFETVRKYLGVSLYYGNSSTIVTGAGIPLWPPVERMQAWPQAWNLPLFDEDGPVTAIPVDRDLVVAERAFSLEEERSLILRIGLSPRDGDRYRGFVEIEQPGLTARYDVWGLDSMEVLEQAVLNAAVRLPFVDPDFPQYPDVRDT